ncbi:MAG: hypothetical protein RR544_04635, partial [Oscillospiraceae bacterium]
AQMAAAAGDDKKTLHNRSTSFLSDENHGMSHGHDKIQRMWLLWLLYVNVTEISIMINLHRKAKKARRYDA